MKRRHFIKATAAGAAAVGGASCTTLGGRQLLDGQGMGDGALDSFLATLDRGLEQITKASFAGKLLPDLWSDPAELEKGQRKHADQVARKALRSLLLTGMVQDLAPADQQHPKVQQKILEHAPEMDEAVFEMHNLLGSMTPGQHGAVQRKLREEPDFGLRIAEELDRPAKEAGVSLGTRIKTRAMISHIAWRMRVQNPALALDEYRDKVTRIGKRSGHAEQIKRMMATKLSAEAFWRHQDQLARLYAQNANDEPGVTEPGTPPPIESAPTSLPTSTPTSAPATPPNRESPPKSQLTTKTCDSSCKDENARLCVKGTQTGHQCVECLTDDHCRANSKSLGSKCQKNRCVCNLGEKEDCRDPVTGKVEHSTTRRNRGDSVMKAAGWITGSGAVVLGLGAILVATGSEVMIAGAIMMTVGGLILLAGLITLLVGVWMS